MKFARSRWIALALMVLAPAPLCFAGYASTPDAAGAALPTSSTLTAAAFPGETVGRPVDPPQFTTTIFVATRFVVTILTRAQIILVNNEGESKVADSKINTMNTEIFDTL
jgi:hypothetical protein